MKKRFETELSEKMAEYERAFGDIYPRCMAPSNPVDAIRTINKCLAAGKPYDPYDGGRIPRDAIF